MKASAVEGISRRVEEQARKSGGALAVTLTGVDGAMAREVQSSLRRRGWSISEDRGARFTLKHPT